MSTSRKGAKILALLAGGSIALAACSTGGNTPDEPDAPAAETKDITITVAHEQEFNAYNNNTGVDNAIKNTVVLNQVLGDFWDFGPDGSVVPTPEFGTYEKTSDDPLTVEYKFHEDAVWSDGEPIDCDDYVLMWASTSGAYDEGDTVLFDPASKTGFELMKKPTCEDGDKEFTIEYEQPYADWIAGTTDMLPAHIAEQKSGVADVIEAVKADDKAELTKVAEFWNNGWRFDPGAIDETITPSSGPYKLGTWEPGQSITLVANDKYWGTPAVAKNIVIRFIVQEEQAQALQNGDVQIAEPQPNPDIISQLEAVGDTITIEQADEFTFEHLDFNFKTVFADANLRKAFALCAPRNEIVDTLIKPVNEEAQILQSRYLMAFQPGYEDIVDEIQDGSYDAPDIAASKALVDAAGAAGTEVRIGYQTPNQRRTNEVDLIRASCEQAGFKITDAGQADFFEVGLDAGNFDVALFAWSGSALVSGSSSNYETGGGNNNGEYTNTEVDELLQTLNVTPDQDAQLDLIKEIETILWDDLATIPLFAFPGVAAWENTVENVQFQPSSSSITWNMHQWDSAS